MLSLNIITNIRAFMQRAQLTGQEVPAYNQVMMALAIEENEARQKQAQVKAVPAAPPSSPPGDKDKAGE